jgi:hypothetical protein
MTDPTEGIRRAMVQEINAPDFEPQGETWNTDQLREEFTVQGFMAPFCIVTRKSTGQRGTLEFQHHPRIYFNWEAD